MSVVVGYVPNPVGEAALAHGIAEARTRKARLLVVNTSRGDSLVDERYADAPALRPAATPRRQRGRPRGPPRDPGP